MSDTLKAWFQTRLGVVINLNPKIFGHHARDGTLLAKILHSYDIINDSQLKTIVHTHDPALSRINLRHLKVWLHFIGVDYDKRTINDISNGKGCTALRLFYRIYLALENKDRLHFITLQREREKFIPTSTKFDVTKVPEESPRFEYVENPLAAPLIQKSENIEWYRETFKDIIDACKHDRKRFKEAQKLKDNSSLNDDSMSKVNLAEIKRSEIKDIDDFERKHKASTSFYEIDKDETKKKSGWNFKSNEIMQDAVEEYLKKLKKRREQETTVKNFKERMQKLLLSEIWEKLLQEQDTKFDEIVAEKVLMQCQYEKRMITDLCEIRRQRNKIAENRQIVEKLVEDMKENEIIYHYNRVHEITEREKRDVENEYERVCELRRRMLKDKIRKIKQKHEKMSSDIVSDLIDISIKAAECLRNNNNCIPRSVWDEWRALFIKNQPIFEPVIDMREGNQREGEKEEKIEDIPVASETQEALSNFDFDSYHKIEFPWNEYLPEIDNDVAEIFKLGEIVVGYIVHKLLEFVYPYPPNPEPAAIPKVDKRVIVLGVPNKILSTLQQLLAQSGIKLIFMEDAINYCLKAYKEEMKYNEYISLTPLTSKEKIFKPKSDSPIKIGKFSKGQTDVKLKASDKQVQTPRDIPYDDMDPNLSNDAYIGKCSYQFLTLGQPISSELNAKILIQYLKSLKDIKGWAIMDYPSNYEQMASLESVLTGIKVPDIPLDTGASELFFTPSRISFEIETLDTNSTYRNSKLMPNPILRTTSESKTLMTGFIRVILKSTDFDDDIFEVLSEDATPMDTFYSNQSVAYVLYYSDFDAFTLKKLARLIIGDFAIPRKSSSDLFGEIARDLEPIQSVKFSIVKQLIPIASEISQSFDYAEIEEITSENVDSPDVIKPGEEGWVWVNFPQSDEILEAMAILWENIESTYISSLKNIFCIKRTHANAIIPYKCFIVKHMEAFISRNDVKQEVFKPFYREFNAFDQIMRMDSEVKCELQCRIADVQSELFEICDQRKKESEEERQRLIEDHWTTMEAIALINVYINIAQVEIDRSIDAIQMVQDYYNSMLQKPLENRFSKVLLTRLDASIGNNVERSKKSKKSKKAKIKKSKSNLSLEPPDSIDCELVKDEIADLLLDVEKEGPNLNQSACYKALKINLNYLENIVDSLAFFNNTMKKGEVELKKEKSKKPRKSSAQSVLNDKLDKYHNLLLEWHYATMFESNRIKMRLKMLDAVFRSDIKFLLDTMCEAFHHLHKVLVDRYEREVNSVKEMANVFYLAVDEERAIEEEMFFENDRFIIKEIQVEEPLLITEEVLPFQFKMAQLGRLMDTLRHAAPQGNMSRRALYYILVDIIRFREEQDEALVPLAWCKLQDEQVCQIIQELFGSDCETIDWREFILYGMEIPTPSTQQILDMRNTYEAFDSQSEEVITREQFHSVPIWFYKSTEIDPNCTHILHKRYLPEKYLGEEENSCYDFKQITGIMLSLKKFKKQRQTFCEVSVDSSHSSFEEHEHETPQEILRFMLAKELLSELFLTNQYFINYMDLLFAFCKDADPRRGFGKALSLELGNPICTNVENGEKYAAELLQQRHCILELEVQKNYMKKEIEEISKSIIEDVLESAIQYTEGISIQEIIEKTEEDIFAEKLETQIYKLDIHESQDFKQRLVKDSDSISILSDRFKIITKDSISSTLITPKWIHSPIGSQTEIDTDSRRILVYWIPKDICLKVLTKRLNQFSKDTEALQSIQEELDSIYESLWDDKLNHDKNIVLSHRLVNHNFIRALLTNISNFTTKPMSSLISKISYQD